MLAFGPFDEVEVDFTRNCDLKDAVFLWTKAKLHLARGEFARAELHTRIELDNLKKTGTAHRSQALETLLDLAESLFGQSKHDAAFDSLQKACPAETLFGQAKHDHAFASLEEARSIVADFALPPDAAWKKTLETWLQRALELDKADVAASLEAELQKMPATANQAFTILEKFRIAQDGER